MTSSRRDVTGMLMSNKAAVIKSEAPVASQRWPADVVALGRVVCGCGYSRRPPTGNLSYEAPADWAYWPPAEKKLSALLTIAFWLSCNSHYTNEFVRRYKCEYLSESSSKLQF